ncbi:hypothetical protein M427DRAFT_63510 [Gonapodya prolifera JEL478]|uniref:Cytochrome b561 domain-containing protein n=1 Tax=Gonapodya prolifera (strain JEL478) TaxID=1344416 RepID=A0A138ZZ40_GONPJ|nr:hypothetical protein M427DRAFT_63510 [Gonapodya prolifera JEL478]|eukprot:KXS09777.1 hypothetical protein M427DRAFT_63510 [Gonapodya prolifera JEL478]
MPIHHTSLLRALGFSLAALLLPGSVFSGRYCSYAASGICINGTAGADGYGDFTLTFPGNVQYFAFGIGTDMPGSDIIAFWVAADGSFVVSDKYGIANAEPPTDSEQDATVLTDSYISGDSIVVIHWRRKLTTGDTRDLVFTTSAANYIWAWKYGSRLSSKSLTTVLGMHDVNENLPTMNLFDVSVVLGADPPNLTGAKSSSVGSNSTSASGKGGSTTPPAPSGPVVIGTTSMEDNDTRSVLLRVHAYLLALTWGVLFPVGVYIMRYGPKRVRSTWHGLVSLLVALLTLVGFALSYSYNSQSSLAHFSTIHSTLGFSALVLILLQTSLGIYSYFSKYRTALVRVRALGRPVQHLVHLWVGRLAVPVLTFAAAVLGIRRYSEMYLVDPKNGYLSAPFFIFFWVVLAVSGELSNRRVTSRVLQRRSTSTKVGTPPSSVKLADEDSTVAIVEVPETCCGAEDDVSATDRATPTSREDSGRAGDTDTKSQ